MNNLFAIGTIIIAASALLQGLSGFGFSILSLPLLAMFLSPKTAVPMLLIFSIIINLTVITTCWRSFSLKNIWLLLIGGILGLPLGTKLLLVLDDSLLRKGIGIFIVIFASVLLTGKRWKLKREKTSQIGIGILSGIFSGSVSMSGPPIILFLSNKGVEKNEFRASLSGYFFLLNLFTIPVYLFNGLFTREVINYSLQWAPALAVGVLAGTFIAGRIKSERFGFLVLVLLLLTGLLSIIK
jgi:uncharacterized membrane protein YfcA